MGINNKMKCTERFFKECFEQREVFSMKLQRIFAMTAIAAFALSTLTGCPWEQEDGASSAPSSSSSRPSHDSDTDSGSADPGPDTPSSTPEQEETIIKEEHEGYTIITNNDTKTVTYEVDKAEGLQAWAEAVTNDLTINCTLETDIEVSNWSPIQNFSGEFDGQGHAISGLTQPLFDTVESGGMVKNVTLEVQITGTNWRVGGIVGDTNEGTIMNCTVSGDISNSRDYTAYTGGIVCDNKGTVIGCTVDSDIQASGENSIIGTSAVAGGIAATNYGTIKGCCYTGTSVQAKNPGTAGGITGICYRSSSITSCYWSCPENGGGTKVGGTITGGQVTDGWAEAIDAMNAQLGNCEYEFALDEKTQKPVLVERNSAEQAVNRLLAQFWG